tara:strand:- start:282569 stop:283756 length:1188 start_codon:yes stop_codon:yes gene_type:complete
MEDDLLKPIDIDLGDYEDDEQPTSLSASKDEGDDAPASVDAPPAVNPAPSNPAPSPEEFDAAMSAPPAGNKPAPSNPAPSPEEFDAAISAPPAGNPAPGNPAPSPEEFDTAISAPQEAMSSNGALPDVSIGGEGQDKPTSSEVEEEDSARDDGIRPIDVMAPSDASSKFGGTANDPLSIEPDVPLIEGEPDLDAVGNVINRLKLGEQINLTRTDPGLKRVLIGMGWDAKVFSDETTPDLDVSLFLLNKDEMTRENEDFVFYNNMETCDGGVCHHGDNRTGAGDGDDENMSMTLSSIPFDVVKVQVVLTIYQGREKEQSFSDVENIFFRIVNADTTIELFRLELDKIVGAEKSVGVKIGHFLREGPNWFFEAEAIAIPRGLDECATEYGIVVAELS